MFTNQEYLISVIIPIYKVEAYLHRCIDSVLAQTYRNLEIILVDDGSPDNCGKICDEYAQKDSRIRVIHKKNGGVSDARNVGLESAKGEYLSFVDSDDYIESTMYEELLRTLLDADADIAACGYYNVRDTITPSCTNVKTKVLDATEGLHEVIFSKTVGIMPWGKLYRRELFNTVMYPKGRICEDVFVIADIFEHVSVAAFNTKPLYYYVHRLNSYTKCKFNKSNLDWIYSYQYLYKRIRQSFPELIEEAKVRLLWAYLAVLDRSILVDEEKELNEKIQRYIRKNISLIKSTFFTRNRKLMALAACMSLSLYKQLIMKFGKKIKT